MAIEWYTPPLEAVTFGGKAKFNIRALESSAAANASLRAEIAITAGDGTGAVVWGTACVESDATGGELATADTAEVAWVAGDDVAIAAGQRLRFRIYIDDTAIGPLVAGNTVTVSYSGPAATTITYLDTQTGTGRINGVGGTEEQLAQSFLVPGPMTLTEVRLTLSKGGTPSDNVVLEIQSDSGGSPSGTVIGTIATVAASSYTGADTLYAYPCGIALPAAASYWIVARRSGARDTANYVGWAAHSPSAYPDGTAATRGSGTWAAIAADLLFAASFTVPGDTNVILPVLVVEQAGSGPFTYTKAGYGRESA